MSFPIIINQANATNNYTYTYTFPTNVDFKSKELCLDRVSLYYSWYSISSSMNNNQFQLIIPTSTTNLTIDVKIDDGTYEIEKLNQFLQNIFIANNLYLVNNTDGSYKYFGEFITNPNAYKVQFNAYPIKTYSGYTAASGMTFPATDKTLQLVINNSNFGRIIGFSPGTYPAGMSGTNYTVLSDMIPQVAPVSGVYIAVSCVDNPYMPDSRVIGQLTTKGVQFGSLIESKENYQAWVPCVQSIRRSVTIEFLTQNLTPLPLLDTDLTLILRIREKPSKE
jgi:hypothetical protein